MLLSAACRCILVASNLRLSDEATLFLAIFFRGLCMHPWRWTADGARGRRAAEGGIHLCRPGRRHWVVLSTRPGAARIGTSARLQGEDDIRGKRAGDRGRGTGDSPTRGGRQPADLYHLVRLHGTYAAGGEAVPEGGFRARHRLQDRGKCRDV